MTLSPLGQLVFSLMKSDNIHVFVSVWIAAAVSHALIYKNKLIRCPKHLNKIYLREPGEIQCKEENCRYYFCFKHNEWHEFDGQCNKYSFFDDTPINTCISDF